MRHQHHLIKNYRNTNNNISSLETPRDTTQTLNEIRKQSSLEKLVSYNSRPTSTEIFHVENQQTTEPTKLYKV